MSSLGTLAPVDYSSREYWEHRYVRSLSGEVEDERGPTFEWLAKPQEMVRLQEIATITIFN